MPPETLEHETRKVLATRTAITRGIKKSMPENLARIGHRTRSGGHEAQSIECHITVEHREHPEEERMGRLGLDPTPFTPHLVEFLSAIWKA